MFVLTAYRRLLVDLEPVKRKECIRLAALTDLLKVIERPMVIPTRIYLFTDALVAYVG